MRHQARRFPCADVGGRVTLKAAEAKYNLPSVSNGNGTLMVKRKGVFLNNIRRPPHLV